MRSSFLNTNILVIDTRMNFKKFSFLFTTLQIFPKLITHNFGMTLVSSSLKNRDQLK